MKFAAVLLVFAGLGYPQQSGQADRKTPSEDNTGKTKPAAVMRRLEGVSWDPIRAQLTWFISVWDLESDMSKPAEVERYVIHVNENVIERDGERRAFEVPGEDLHALMDIISTYAMRSTVWWGHSAATDQKPNDQKQPDKTPDGTDGSKDKTKGNGGEEKPKPTVPGKAAGVLQEMGALQPGPAEPAGVAH